MSENIRLLLVGPLPPPPGGMANQTRQLMRLLQSEGVLVSVVQTNAPYHPVWIGSIKGVRAAFRLAPYLRDLWRLVPGADVVHVMANSGWAWYLFAAPAIWVARRHGKPTIVNYRGGLAAEFLQSSAARVRRTLERACLVVPSEFLRAVFGRHGLSALVVPNIVDTDVFRPATRHDPADDQKTPHVVIARNLEKIYGIDVGLRALAILRTEHPGLRASIAGSGPDRAQLEALASALGLGSAVRFTGQLDVPAMAALYQSADLVLNPVRADNTPNSVLESLACGVPVVTTNVGGVPHLVEHRVTAWLTEPECPSALAEGMSIVLRDRELQRGLSTQGRIRAERCAWPVVKDQWLQIYRSTMGR